MSRIQKKKNQIDKMKKKPNKQINKMKTSKRNKNKIERILKRQNKQTK